DSFAIPTTKPSRRGIDGRTAGFVRGGESLDGYLAKIDASGQFRVYSTYIGGPGSDVALGVAVDAQGAAYVTGWTDSTAPEPTPDPSASPTTTPSPTPAIHFPITDNA